MPSEEASQVPEAGKRMSWFRDLFLLLTLTGLLFLAFGTGQALRVPDEARYSEIAREMVLSGDYVTPHLDGLRFLEKPPLFFWLQTFSIRFFGLDERSLRIWPALFGMAGCLLAYAVGRRFFSRRAGMLGAGCLATNLLYFALSRYIVLDMAVTFFVSATLVSFLFFANGRGIASRESSSTLWLLPMYSSAALAVLAKGLIGVLLPGIIIVLWVTMTRQWLLLRTIKPAWGLLLFAAIAAPWHILVALRNTDFLWFYFGREHFLRFFTEVHHRDHPAWFFVAVTILGFMPWTIFLTQTIVRSVRKFRDGGAQQQVNLFFLLWAGVVLVFFSFSSSKLIPYVLPICLPLSVLVGEYLDAHLTRPSREFAAGLYLFGFVPLVVAALLWLTPSLIGSNLSRIIQEPMESVGVPFSSLSVPFFVAGILLLLALRVGRQETLLLMFFSSAILLIFCSVAAANANVQSVKKLALSLRPRLLQTESVACYQEYLQDLPFYLRQKVIMAGWENESEFRAEHARTHPLMMDEETFWQRWGAGETPMYLVIGKERFSRLSTELKRRTHLVDSTSEYWLLSDRPLDTQPASFEVGPEEALFPRGLPPRPRGEALTIAIVETKRKS